MGEAQEVASARSRHPRYRVALVREAGTPYDQPIRCDDPPSVARLAHALIGDSDREVLGVFLFDHGQRLIGHHIAYVGTLGKANVHPRGVFLPALMANAATVIVFHNHPSGDPTPSYEDVAFTRRIVDAGELLGIPVLDHVVVGEEGRYVSVADSLR